MAIPAKGPRLHKFTHRPNWFIRDTGVPDQSTGTPCYGRAVAALASYRDQKAVDSRRDTEGETLEAVARRLVRKSKERAALSGQPHTLEISDVLAMIEAQGGICALSGMPLSFEKSATGRRKPFAPSLDRVDCAGGYTLENCRIVCVIVNLSRGDFSDAEFIAMCKAVASRS